MFVGVSDCGVEWDKNDALLCSRHISTITVFTTVINRVALCCGADDEGIIILGPLTLLTFDFCSDENYQHRFCGD